MAGFNIAAQVQLQGPTNLNAVAQQIRAALGTITATVNVNVSSSASGAIAQITNAMNQLTAALTAFRTNSTAANTAMGNLAASSGRAAAAAPAIASGFSSATASVRSLNQAVSSADNSIDQFGKTAGLALRRFAGFSIAAGGVFGLINAFKEGTAEALQFEREMVKLVQVGAGTTAEIRGIQEEVSRLSTTMGVSSRSLIQASVTLAQAGLTARQTKEALEALARTALSPNFDDLNKTVDGSIAVMQQFRIESNQLNSALGSMNAVAGAFAVESRDLIEAVKRSGGAFRATGGDLNEFLALFTSVRATTRESAETIATGLRTVFTRAQRYDTVQALKDLGIQMRFTREEAEALGRADLTDQFVGPFEAVRRLSTALKDLPSTDPRFAGVVEALGGYRQVAKVIPLIQEFALAQKALGVAQAGTSSTVTAAEQAQASFLVRLQGVKEQFYELFRILVGSDAFQVFLDTTLKLTSALVKLGNVLSPILPLLLTLATIKVATALPAFIGGFAAGFGGQQPRRVAAGGHIPGVGNTDSVPAMLMPGEFVIRKQAAQSIGYAALNQMNTTGRPVQHFATGGAVLDMDKLAPGGKVSLFYVVGGTGSRLVGDDTRKYVMDVNAGGKNSLLTGHSGDVLNQNRPANADVNTLRSNLGTIKDEYRTSIVNTPQYLSLPSEAEKENYLRNSQRIRDYIQKSGNPNVDRLLAVGVPPSDLEGLLSGGKSAQAAYASILGNRDNALENKKQLAAANLRPIGAVSLSVLEAGLKEGSGSARKLGNRFVDITKNVIAEAVNEITGGSVTPEVSTNVVNNVFKNVSAGGLFEAATQVIAGVKRVKSSQEAFDFSPSKTTKIASYFSDDAVGTFADAKYSQNLDNRKSIVSKAIRQFGFSDDKGNVPYVLDANGNLISIDDIQKINQANLRTGAQRNVNARGDLLLVSQGANTRNYYTVGNRIKFARGGVVPGMGDTDSVPALLMPGEFVIRKDSAQSIGYDMLQQLNGYASGGIVKKMATGGDLFNYNGTMYTYDELVRLLRQQGITNPLNSNLPGLTPPNTARGNQTLLDQRKSLSAYRRSPNEPVREDSSGIKRLRIPVTEAEKFGVISLLQEDTSKAGYDFPSSKALRSFGSGKINAAAYAKIENAIGSDGIIDAVIDRHILSARTRNEYTRNVEGRILSGINNVFTKTFPDVSPDVIQLKATDPSISGLSGTLFEKYIAGLSKVQATGGNEKFDFATGKFANSPIQNFVYPKLRTGLIDVKRSIEDNNLTSLMSKYMNLAFVNGPVSVQGRVTAGQDRATAGVPAGANIDDIIEAARRRIRPFASGGRVNAGIPALLTPGEFVFNANSASRIGLSRLHSMNNGGVARFNRGGFVQHFAGGGPVRRSFVTGAEIESGADVGFTVAEREYEQALKAAANYFKRRYARSNADASEEELSRVEAEYTAILRQSVGVKKRQNAAGQTQLEFVFQEGVAPAGFNRREARNFSARLNSNNRDDRQAAESELRQSERARLRAQIVADRGFIDSSGARGVGASTQGINDLLQKRVQEEIRSRGGNVSAAERNRIIQEQQDKIIQQLIQAEKNRISSIDKNIKGERLHEIARENVVQALAQQQKVILNENKQVVGISRNAIRPQVSTVTRVDQNLSTTAATRLEQGQVSPANTGFDISKISSGALVAGAAAVATYGQRLVDSIFGKFETLAATAITGSGEQTKDISRAQFFGRAAGSIQGAAVGIAGGAALGNTLGQAFPSIPNIGAIGAAVGAAVGAIYGFVSVMDEQAKIIANLKLTKAIDALADRINVITSGKFVADESRLSDISSRIGNIRSKTVDAADAELGFFGKLVSSTATESATFEKLNRERLGSQLSSLTQLQDTRLTQIINARLRGGASALPNQEDITSVINEFKTSAGGFGNEILNISQQVRDLSFTQLNEELRRHVQSLYNSTAVIERETIARGKTESLIVNFANISTAIESATLRLNEFTNNLNISADLIEGRGSLGARSNLAERAKAFGTTDNVEFSALVNSVLAPFGKFADNLSAPLLELNNLKSVLPDILSQAANSARPLEGDTVSSRIEQIMRGGTFGNFDQSLINRLTSSLDKKFKPEEIIPALRVNLQGVSKDLFKDADAGLSDAFATVARGIDEQGQRLFAAFQRDIALFGIIEQSLSKVSEITLTRNRTFAEDNANRVGRRGDGLAFLPLAQVDRPFRERQELLTRGSGVDGFNVREISNRLSKVAVDIREQQSRALAAPLDKDAALKLNDLNKEATNLQKALRNLTEVSTRLSGVQERLSQIQQDREGRTSFGERYISADPAQRAELDRSMLLTLQAIQRGSLEGFSSDDSSKILNLLNSVGNVRIPNAGNRTGNQVKDFLVSQFGGGIFQPTAGTQREEDSLKSRRDEVLEQAQQAAQTLAKFQETEYTKFIDKLSAQQTEFLKNLEAQLTRNFVRSQGSELAQDRAKLGELVPRQQAATTLRGIGVVSKQDFEALNAAKNEIETLVKLRSQIVPGNRQDIASILEGEDFRRGTLGEKVGSSGEGIFGYNIFSGMRTVEAILDKLSQPEIKSKLGLENATPGQLRQIAVEGVANVSPSLGNLRQITDKDVTTALVDSLKKFSEEQNARNKERLDKAEAVVAPKGVTLENAQQVLNALNQFKNVEQFANLGNSFNTLSKSVKDLEISITNAIARLGALTPPIGKASGGVIYPTDKKSPFARGTDVVPAMLTPGEFVVRREVAQKHLPMLEALNQGVEYFATGGFVRRRLPAFPRPRPINRFQQNVPPLPSYLLETEGQPLERVQNLLQGIPDEDIVGSVEEARSLLLQLTQNRSQVLSQHSINIKDAMRTANPSFKVRLALEHKKIENLIAKAAKDFSDASRKTVQSMTRDEKLSVLSKLPGTLFNTIISNTKGRAKNIEDAAASDEPKLKATYREQAIPFILRALNQANESIAANPNNKDVVAFWSGIKAKYSNVGSYPIEERQLALLDAKKDAPGRKVLLQALREAQLGFIPLPTFDEPGGQTLQKVVNRLEKTAVTPKIKPEVAEEAAIKAQVELLKLESEEENLNKVQKLGFTTPLAKQLDAKRLAQIKARKAQLGERIGLATDVLITPEELQKDDEKKKRAAELQAQIAELEGQIAQISKDVPPQKDVDSLYAAYTKTLPLAERLENQRKETLDKAIKELNLNKEALDKALTQKEEFLNNQEQIISANPALAAEVGSRARSAFSLRDIAGIAASPGNIAGFLFGDVGGNAPETNVVGDFNARKVVSGNLEDIEKEIEFRRYRIEHNEKIVNSINKNQNNYDKIDPKNLINDYVIAINNRDEAQRAFSSVFSIRHEKTFEIDKLNASIKGLKTELAEMDPSTARSRVQDRIREEAVVRRDLAEFEKSQRPVVRPAIDPVGITRIDGRGPSRPERVRQKPVIDPLTRVSPEELAAEPRKQVEDIADRFDADKREFVPDPFTRDESDKEVAARIYERKKQELQAERELVEGSLYVAQARYQSLKQEVDRMLREDPTSPELNRNFDSPVYYPEEVTAEQVAAIESQTNVETAEGKYPELLRAEEIMKQAQSKLAEVLRKQREFDAPRKFNLGGFVVPGVGSTDTVPAMLTPGEFVVNKRAVEMIGKGRLERINYFATGGSVPGGNPSPHGPTANGTSWIPPEAISAMESLSATMSQFGAMSGNLVTAMLGFTSSTTELASAMNNFPRVIEGSFKHSVNINHNGLEVLTRLMPEMQEIAINAAKNVLRTYIDEHMPDAGTPI